MRDFRFRKKNVFYELHIRQEKQTMVHYNNMVRPRQNTCVYSVIKLLAEHSQLGNVVVCKKPFCFYHTEEMQLPI